MENLFERILRVVELKEGNSQTAFAKKIGCQQSTFNGYMNHTGQRKIRMTLLDAILREYPDLSREWLYFGEGAMRRGDSLPPPRSMHNKEGKLVGDLLHVVLGWLTLSTDEAATKTGIHASTLKSILESRLLPNFEQLEALYRNLHIEPAYFFDGNEYRMHMPEDTVLRVMWALGRAGLPVSGITLSEIFDVPLDEAKDFYKEWKEFQQEGNIRVLPEHWLQNLRTRYAFNTGWFNDLNPPLLIPREEYRTGSAIRDGQKTEREDIIAALRQVIAAQEKTILAQEDLINRFKLRESASAYGAVSRDSGEHGAAALQESAGEYRPGKDENQR